MVVKTSVDNQTNRENPLIDTGQVTVNAFNVLNNKMKKDKNFILGQDDKLGSSPVHKVKIKAWTQDDDQTHTYFHSLSIDTQVEDFMGTAELKCPYDSDLMEYWEPIRQTVVIYGSNKGDYKILFIGRVREVKQDGYELVIGFQNYGWKFKQNVSQSYSKDNVLNKDGYTIMRLMFEALKIDSYVISESAKNRLKQVGINDDGNVTVNGQEIEEVPDLIERLKGSDPSKLVSEATLEQKVRESQLHNIKDINYTLKYEEPTPVMKEISSQGSYSAGKNMYANSYGSASGGGGGGAGGGGGNNKNCNAPSPSSFCPGVQDSGMAVLMKTVYLFNRDCNGSNELAVAKNRICNYAKNSNQAYKSQVVPCLNTLSKYSIRGDKRNGASEILSAANSFGVSAAGFINSVGQTIGNVVNAGVKAVQNTVNYVANGIKAGYNAVANWVGGWFK